MARWIACRPVPWLLIPGPTGCLAIRKDTSSQFLFCGSRRRRKGAALAWQISGALSPVEVCCMARQHVPFPDHPQPAVKSITVQAMNACPDTVPVLTFADATTRGRFQVKCPRCSHDNPADARFCQNCGQQLTQRCPKCGTQNAPDARFCKQCGDPLAASSDLKTNPPATTQSTRSPAVRARLHAGQAQYPHLYRVKPVIGGQVTCIPYGPILVQRPGLKRQYLRANSKVTLRRGPYRYSSRNVWL